MSMEFDIKVLLIRTFNSLGICHWLLRTRKWGRKFACFKFGSLKNSYTVQLKFFVTDKCQINRRDTTRKKLPSCIVSYVIWWMTVIQSSMLSGNWNWDLMFRCMWKILKIWNQQSNFSLRYGIDCNFRIITFEFRSRDWIVYKNDQQKKKNFDRMILS